MRMETAEPLVMYSVNIDTVLLAGRPHPMNSAELWARWGGCVVRSMLFVVLLPVTGDPDDDG